MKYTKEERLDIGRRIYDGELTRYEAAKEYEISEQTARNYMRLYRDVNHLPPRKGAQHICGLAKTRSAPAPTGLEELQSMTKEEQIDALVMAKITEARLKKRLSGGRSWCAQEVHSYRQEECQVVMELSGQFPIQLLAGIDIQGPMGCIVSDMTVFYVKGTYYELTLYMDLWNDELIAHALSSRRGDRMTYLAGLQDVLAFKKQYPEYKLILHSDQGSVYASKSYNELLPMYNITRSMSRAGTPTDNAAMESINGWIKAELFTDFHITSSENVPEQVSDYIRFFNEERPAYTLGYLTPKQYRERFSPKQEYAAQTTAGDV